MKRANKPLLPTEAQIQASILDYLNMKGHFCWRNSSGLFKVGDRYINAGKGRADILGIARDSRFIAVEVKKKGGRASQEQEAFIEEIRGRGGVGLIAYSLEEVMEVL